MAIKKEDYDYLYKIILVGDPKVGKTSFLTRLFFTNLYFIQIYKKYHAYKLRLTQNHQFNNKIYEVPTIGVEYSTKCVLLKNGEGIVKAQIWDTSGSEKYKSITTALIHQIYKYYKRHYRKAVGALLFYDLTDEQSFSNTQDWLKEIQMHTEEGIAIMLIGNKLDLIDEDPSQRKVSVETVTNFCRSQQLIYQETSAKTGFNVKESFEELIQFLVEIYNIDKKIGRMKDEPYENIMITPENYQKNVDTKTKNSDNSCACN